MKPFKFQMTNKYISGAMSLHSSEFSPGRRHFYIQRVVHWGDHLSVPNFLSNGGQKLVFINKLSTDM